MIILSIRTDKPESEIGLYDGNTKLAYEIWPAHRQLAETLHIKIQSLLIGQSKDIHHTDGIVCFQGPGSFTGLRIGLTVANALATSLEASIVASQGDDWLHKGIERLLAAENDRIVLPEYGADAHITLPKH